MEYLTFPARLQAPYNNILEYGDGSLDAGGSAIHFLADFVPLVPLGAPARIEWLYADRVVTAYEGSVYLSTPTMLRLVDVDEALVARAQGIFASNTRLPGLARRSGKELPAFPVEALYLSVGMVKLSSPVPVEVDEKLSLHVEVDFLTLQGLSLRVRQAVPLRRETLLLCEVERSGSDNYIALSTYSSRLDRIGKAD